MLWIEYLPASNQIKYVVASFFVKDRQTSHDLNSSNYIYSGKHPQR